MTHLPSNRPLDCALFEERIHRILDDRLTVTGDDLLMAHASECEPCARLLNDYESVEDSVKFLPGEIDKILGAQQEFSVTRGLGFVTSSRHFSLIASLAALIVICVGVINSFDTRHQSRSSRLADSTVNGSSPEFSPRPVDVVPAKTRRKTPDTSPFSQNFSVANSITLISLPEVPSWDDVSRKLDPLEPVITYSAEIPGVRPMQCSLNATLELLKRSFSKSEPEIDPDLGFSIDSRMLAAA